MVDYLPVGSIVRLKNAEKRLMIVGIIQMEEGNKESLHDYMGVPYPEGYLGPGMNFLFDKEQIEEVVFLGFEDEEREAFMQVIATAVDVVAERIGAQKRSI